MSTAIRTVIYAVRDLDRAKAMYTALLGVEPTNDAPYYVGYSIDGQDIGLDPDGHAHGMTGPVAYVHVDDIDAALAVLVSGGGEPHGEVRDVGGGRRIVTVTDPDGNAIGLLADTK
jgi:predicted enzyme related to lactoylglutathione lyase